MLRLLRAGSSQARVLHSVASTMDCDRTSAGRIPDLKPTGSVLGTDVEGPTIFLSCARIFRRPACRLVLQVFSGGRAQHPEAEAYRLGMPPVPLESYLGFLRKQSPPSLFLALDCPRSVCDFDRRSCRPLNSTQFAAFTGLASANLRFCRLRPDSAGPSRAIASLMELIFRFEREWGV